MHQWITHVNQVGQGRLPGVVLVRERYRTNALANEVDGKRHLKEGFHLTRMEVQLLRGDEGRKGLVLVGELGDELPPLLIFN